MSAFEKVKFQGKFRVYQQRVLDNFDKHIKDGKINIVAAPGSGKTVLGLELICRLGSPCIVLSPTTAIREQWGERFKELFLENKEDFDNLFSRDLHKVKLLNSITYQALYTAIEKIHSEDEEDTDCSDIELFEIMKEFGIKTVCLDEAHHLKNEWQKALEKFISALDTDVKIISLTATPPYDSEGSEWNRYMSICGEIDEEIFVPELVGQNTLCPHQDYVFFNYPTETELSSFQTHKEKSVIALEELGKLVLFKEVNQKLNQTNDYEALFSSVKEYVSLLVLLKRFNYIVSEKLIKELTAKKHLPPFKMSYAECAIQFLLDGEIITEEQKAEILDILKNNSVYEKRKVTLDLNEKLKRALISSVGKLESIKKIAQSETKALGEKLRMLVLTDYIKKENVSKIATEDVFNSVNVVSIFETIRRETEGVKIGVLSGTLVILPNSIDLSQIKHRKEQIENTEYSVVEFSGSTHKAVDYVGKLFEMGEIQILVGTKSLLGEGWDSPCINSLILASFVGSFVLSNQMRGRAIRMYKNDPEKTANIWHLVTIEPEYLLKEKNSQKIKEYMKQDERELISCDYDVLKRRFDSFMGPNYSTGVIESGIERITAIKPPFNKEGITRINDEMLKLSAKRGEVKSKWKGEVTNSKFNIAVETEVPKEKKAPAITFWDITFSVAVFSIQLILISILLIAILKGSKTFALLTLAVMIVLSVVLFKGIKKISSHFSPANSVKTLGKAVYKTLYQCDLISSSAKVEALTNKQNTFVSLQLINASVHDQNIFNTAMAEMLSPIENPRYILIAKTIFKKYNYKLSFACPSIIGKKKENVELLAENLKKSTGNFEPVYTHRENGRQLILKCRKKSYITLDEKQINKKYKVSHWN